MARQARFDSIFNASLEDQKLQIYSRVFKFEARGITKVPEEITAVIENEYTARGLVAIYPGDDRKAKERQALIAYLQTLNQRIQNYQSEADEAKRRGVTLDEASAWKRAKRWKEEILTKLNVEAPLEIEKSFLDEKDLGTNIFASMPVVETVEETVKRKPGNPKWVKSKSFSDTNIEDELGV